MNFTIYDEFNLLSKDGGEEIMQSQKCLSYPFFVTGSEPEADFEAAVMQAVNDVLSALGENAKQAVYGHLENRYGLSKEDIPSRIGAFSDAIEETLGTIGKLIEIKIMERLHSRYTDFRCTARNGELDFVEYMSCLQKALKINV